MKVFKFCADTYVAITGHPSKTSDQKRKIERKNVRNAKYIAIHGGWGVSDSNTDYQNAIFFWPKKILAKKMFLLDVRLIAPPPPPSEVVHFGRHPPLFRPDVFDGYGPL